ncbi:hypothetical protein OM076_04695 [Solirubrobacter ginsenosidimutans]|uniref:Uncharacterized protein n=1 Tax=Solirubrobacter ginsenosidimutans TaxID=490573 RepID=A0A9X3S3I9_9ACTN|nr:hypothetical protein [Solirubrobacter ginsenosidimutans]MDA0159553.1 hypothetical protein [Solirubrobacter ginsenosidimutans]
MLNDLVDECGRNCVERAHGPLDRLGKRTPFRDKAIDCPLSPSSRLGAAQGPDVAKLPVVAEHRSVYTAARSAGAIYFTSPLSLPYVLEHLTPQLAKALAGTAAQRVEGTGEEVS